jgi:hypothetical protein
LLITVLVALLLSLSPDASAQPVTGGVTGTVVEARTGAPLAAVLVKIQSTGQQSFSNAEGRFEIADVPAGPQTVLVSVVGYGLVRRDVIVESGSAVDITIPVAEGASTYVEDVSISASPFREAEPGVVSQSVLGSRDLLALRGLVADDPFRAVQVLPGVSTGDDFRAEFALRGLGPTNIGMAVDGVDSPLLFHTVRGVQDTGSLGLINSDILESATLMAGPHPQRLASHIGSRLDFTTRDGSRDRLVVRGLLSASAASTVLEGPLGAGKNASWLVAVRKSYIDWLLRKIDSTTDTTFGFTDAQGKLTVDLSPRQTLRVTMLAGRSVLRENDDPPGANTLDPATSTTFIGNVQWRFTPSAKFAITQQAYVLQSEYRNQVFDGRTREEGDDGDFTWRGGAEWNPAAGHLFEFGAQAQRLDANRIDRRFTGQAEFLVQDSSGEAWSTAVWGQYRWTPGARFSLTPGVRVDRWGLIDQAKASPWLLSEFAVTSSLRARFGASLQHQAPGLDHTFYMLPDAQLRPERGLSIEAGLEQRLGPAWRLAGSVYRRDDDDRLRFQATEVRIENNRVVVPRNPHWENALEGLTNGVELMLERKSVNGLNGWLSYAWSKSDLSDSRGGSLDPPETFPADFDQRHTVNAYVAYRWSGRTSLSARLRYGSNFPIPGYIARDANGYLLSDQRNGTRLPEYARLDLRAERAFTYRKSRLTLFIEVVNATNHDNYRYDTPGINLTTRRVFEPLDALFPLLPVAGILIEF